MPDDELQRLISDVTALKVFFHDETAEKIFSNNIDTWKNMGNFQFVDRVGQCFALVKTGENYWSDWVLEVDDVTKEIKAHTNAYEGKNYMIKCLRNDNVRSKIARLHKFRGWLNYTAAVICYNNRINMACIGISEDEVMAFTKEREKEVQYEGQVPNAYDYYTPDLDPDSLITLKRFNEMIEK